MKKIYLVDVSSMFFRAFYAIRPLTSPSGLPVNAVYGFLSMVVKLIKDEKPDYLVFCYDRKEPSFRKEIYQEYKANRTEMPEDLAKQIPYIKKLAELIGIPALEIPSYEADDIIGTLTQVGLNHKLQVVIVSGDKDFGQLVKPGVILLDTMKDLRIDVDGVKEKWGIKPEHFIDYLAIVGDTSDNVPGVDGIGPKGAVKLIEQFGSLENIYENIDQISSASIKDKLIKSKDQAFVAKKLVTIVTDVPVSQELESYKLQPLKQDELRALLQELNFKSFEKSLLGESGIVSGVSKAQESAQDDSNSNQYDVNKQRTFILVGGDEEKFLTTNSSIQAYFNAQSYFFVRGEQVLSIESSERAAELVANKKLKWSGFDLKTLWHNLRVQDAEAEFDSMLAAYALKAGDCSDWEKVFKENFPERSIPDLASWDQFLNLQLDLEETLRAKLEHQQVKKVFSEIELPLMPVLYKMENRGIMIDQQLLGLESEELAVDINRLEHEIHDLAGQDFNVASPKQLSQILFEKMGLEGTKKTKTGWSTDNDVLASLNHPIAAKILNYRELAKLKSTYVDALPEMVSPQDGRVHTSLNQAMTSTGRLSSTHPNLQNIPIRTERGQRVRKAFIAQPGMRLLSADYSQIELRILAHVADDKGLQKAFAEDLDIHTATAAEIYGLALSDVNAELRRTAKAVNFGIAYGQGAFGLAENLGISRGEAQEIINKYFAKFPGVRDYIESTIKLAHEQGYVETLFGRRRYIDELKSKNAMLKKFGERAAINAPIQGTASDLVKKAMIELDKSVQVPMLLQVHDELIFEAPQEQLEAEAKRITDIMENIVSLKVPLKVNYAIGPNWDEAH